MLRSTSILHRAKACNDCRTSGVRDKGYCSQLFESPWTTVPLFKQPAVAGTLWAAGLSLGILPNPPCRCKKNNRLIRCKGFSTFRLAEIYQMIPSGCVLSYLIRSYHIWSVYAALFSCLEQVSNWNILKSTEFHCQATGRKRGQGGSRDDAFGISMCPVLGVFGGVFCPIVGFLPLLSRFNPWTGIAISFLGTTEPIILNRNFPELSDVKCSLFKKK